MKTPEAQAIGDRLARIRIANCLSQAEAASLMGVHNTWLCHIERGYRMLKVSSLIRFCNFYGVSADEILGMRPMPSANEASGFNRTTPFAATPARKKAGDPWKQA